MEINPRILLLNDVEVRICRMPSQGRQRDNERLYAQGLIDGIFNCHVEILHEQSGKPYLEGFPDEISISHTKGFVAVARNMQNPSVPVGVDIEYVSDRVLRVLEKFLTENETALAEKNAWLPYRDFCLVAWCAKEAAYKKCGVQGVDFKEHFRISDISAASVALAVSHPDIVESTICFRYLVTPGYVLVAG